MIRKRVLVTGSNGFVGKFVVSLLKEKNYTVIGTERSKHAASRGDGVVYGDLCDLTFAESLVQKTQPDYVVHLAGQSSVGISWQEPRMTVVNNVLAQLHLLEALRLHAKPKKVLIVSSADVYGVVDKKDNPIDEETPIKLQSPYATSKMMQENLGMGYVHNFEMPIVIARPFGHIGPGQPSKNAIPSFIEKIKKAPDGGTIAVGNIKVRRDYSDVRDIVRAYVLGLEKGEVGEAYNLGAGKSYLLADVLHSLIKISGKKLNITIDKSLYRKHDIMETVCDYTKFKKATGWEPEIPIEQTLSDMWNRNST